MTGFLSCLSGGFIGAAWLLLGGSGIATAEHSSAAGPLCFAGTLALVGIYVCAFFAGQSSE